MYKLVTNDCSADLEVVLSAKRSIAAAKISPVESVQVVVFFSPPNLLSNVKIL